MKTKIYIVSTAFSRREICARSRKEAIMIFRKQLACYVSTNDKIAIN
jgi:hypothetical protein